LQQLSFCATEINDLTPLSGLTALEEVLCDNTNVNAPAPIAVLAKLKRIECSHCRLTDFPTQLLKSESLEKLTLYETFVPGVPTEVRSQTSGDNCLESLRAHFRDLDAGSVSSTDVKLIVIGNGRVGKTQICRRLRNEAYDPAIPSTHGIKIHPASLPMQDGEAIKLHIWDFGGQEIYHGTHALFMKTNAVFMIVWTPGMEDPRSCDQDGFRNYPLAYWVDYVRQLGGKEVPVLVVQSQCDWPQNRAACPVPAEKLHEAFDYHPSPLHYSAANNSGRAALVEALQEAVRWLHDRQGIATIGAGRNRVKLRLEAMRDTDAKMPVEQRQYRTIAQDHFRRICDEENGTSDPRYLLSYLHNVGIVFYQEGLFDDGIVLDQQWALDAIYAVFDRDKCVKLLRQLHGRFTRSLLELIVWQGYKPAEQELFLDMMQSCGICFVHKRGDERLEIEPEYIAPDLLPEKSALATELIEKWDPSSPGEEAVWDFDLLHQGLVRAILSRIGREAGVSAIYWQGGLCVFEATTRSHALIEQEMGAGWAGRIRLQTQGDRATTLLERLSEPIEWEIRRLGLAPRKAPPRRAASHEAPTGEFSRLEYADARRSSEPCWYVSYAWNDSSAEGKTREAIVDRLCAEAQARGTPIIRDKTTLKVGDSIARFMNKIGRGDRVFVILSDKYLKSPFCMYELFEIWRNSRQEEEEFLKRSRVYCLDDARFGTIPERLHYAKHWKTQHDEIEATIKELGPSVIATKDLDDLKLMQLFTNHVGDILRMFADIVQPRSFEELKKYGFDDPPGARRDI
jgi:internalin A